MNSLIRNKLLHKVLSAVLAFMLVVSLVPTYAFAADEQESAGQSETADTGADSSTGDSDLDADISGDSSDPVDEPDSSGDASDSSGDVSTPDAEEETDPTGDSSEPAEGEPAQQDDTAAIAPAAEEGDSEESTVADPAPRSSVESIAPGEYKVTANLYVPAKYNSVLACNAYVSSSAFPPVDPEYENATLVVAGTGSEKTYTLTLDVNSEYFTIQTLAGCSNAELTATQYKNGAYGPQGKRITQITVSLKDLSGLYKFDESSAYPVPLSTTWNIPIYLGVRLSETSGKVIEEQTLTVATYDDPSTFMSMFGFDDDTIANHKNDVTVTVKNSSIDLSSAKLVVSRIESGDSRFDSVYGQLQNTRSSTSTNTGLFMYDISIVDADGNPISVSDARSITVTVSDAGAKCAGGWTPQEIAFASTVSDYTAFYYNNGSMELIGEGTVANDYSAYYLAADRLSIDLTSLDSHFVLAGVANATESTTRFSGSWTQDGATGSLYYPMNYMGIEIFKTVKFKAENLNGANDAQIKQMLGNENAEIIASYKTAVYYNSGANQVPQMGAVGSDKKCAVDFTVAVPMNNIPADEAKAYLITVDESGAVTYERLTITDGENGTGVVSILSAGSSLTEMQQKCRLYQLGAAVIDSSRIGQAPNTTVNGKYSYIAVVHDNTPSVGTDLTYTGKEQTGVYESLAYTLTGVTKATDAGEYVAYATLNDENATWTDGYEGNKREIKWSIAQKKLTAEYTSEAISSGETPAYKVRVYGFVNGDSADKLEGFESPTVTSADLSAGKHVLTPTGGNATGNYKFNYESGTLYVDYKVISYDAKNDPLNPFRYYGDKDPIVSTDIIPAEAGTITWYETWNKDYESSFLQVGGTISHAGSYTCLIQMNDGYVYEYNGGYYESYKDLVRIMPTYVTVNISIPESIYSDELPDVSEIPYTLSGMKYDETEETAEAWIGPNFVISINDNVATITIDNTRHGEIYPDSTYPSSMALSRDYLVGNDQLFNQFKTTLIDPTEEQDGETVLVADRIARDAEVIANAQTGDSITIKMADATVMPQEYLTAMANKDITVTFTGDNFYETINPSKIAVPVASNLNYTGEVQTGIASSIAYTLTDATATNAGTYTATATLNSGFRWADGTTEAKEISWSIAKADPEYTIPTGLTATEGDTLSNVTLPDGFAWKDSTEGVGAAGENTFTAVYTPADTDNYNTVDVNVTVTVAAKQAETLAPGTYRVTANLYLPGEKNTQLPGVTAYMTNPNNPVNQIPDNMPENWTFEATVPNKPAENNATLVVKEDGTQIVILDVVNPVFTLQSIASGDNVTVLAAQKDSKTYSDNAGTNSRNGRVVKLYAQLGDNSGHYYFGDCIEFPTLLGANWNVPLEMGVDFTSAAKISDSTDIGLKDEEKKDDTDKKDDSNKQDEVKYEAPVLTSGNGSEWAYGTETGLPFTVSGNCGALLSVAVDGKDLGSSYFAADGSNVTLNASYLNTIEMGKHNFTLTYQGGAVFGEFTTKEGTKEIQVTKLKPGTYTVTANVWFEKADSGLPMNPHLTNSSFPPKDPVSNNATLTVDNDGHAYVTVPIVIQSKVMTIQKITGLGLSGSTRDANGNLTSVTVDLGVLEDFDSVISKTCSVQLKMGDLAMSISGFDRDHTWKAHFQVNLSGVPTVLGTHTIYIGQNGEEVSPQTADTAPVMVFAVVLVVAVVGAGALTVGKKRRKH